MKHCRFCHRTLDERLFAIDKRYADGRNPRCNDCSAGREIEQPAEPCISELVQHPKPPENPWIEAKRQRNELRRERAPGRRRARKMVEKALESGTITRQKCQIKGPNCATWPTQAHHVSYEEGQELQVIWACKPCHDALTEPVLAQSNASRRQS